MSETAKVRGGGYVKKGWMHGAGKAFYPNKPVGQVNRVIDVDWHRNGSGNCMGFYTVVFEWLGDDVGHSQYEGPYLMNAVLFNCSCEGLNDSHAVEGHKCDPCFAVQYVGDLAKGVCDNALRGDYFIDDIRRVVKAYWEAGWPDIEGACPLKPDLTQDALAQEQANFAALGASIKSNDEAMKVLR